MESLISVRMAKERSTGALGTSHPLDIRLLELGPRVPCIPLWIRNVVKHCSLKREAGMLPSGKAWGKQLNYLKQRIPYGFCGFALRRAPLNSFSKPRTKNTPHSSVVHAGRTIEPVAEGTVREPCREWDPCPAPP